MIQENADPNFKIQIANRNLIKVTKQLILRFFSAGRCFEKTFISLPTLGMVLIVMSFFEKYLVTIDVKKFFSTTFGQFNASMQKVQQERLEKFCRITDNSEDRDPAVPTSDGTRPR